MGGAGSGISFRNNVSALSEILLNTKLIHQVKNPSTETEVLGFKLKLPMMVAPIGGIGFNLSGAMEETAYQEAVACGAVDAGVIAGTPDAVPIEVMKAGLSMAQKLGGKALPFIKPWEPEKIKEKLIMAKEAGCKTVACDLDSIGLITLRLMGHPAYPKSEPELKSIVTTAREMGLKFVIKGVMCPEDAEACLAAGVDGIVVSNHGGRVLDSAPGTAKVLPAIVAKAKGKAAILVDGGVRSGGDIFKMLALGADCVMIGRPCSIAAIGGGREGVALYVELLRSQLEQVMIMTGCPDVKSAGSAHLWN
jgi:isopentenyl diphosphate isomerase/L-lactate dehydrogenase-like FMN-dependent dehydrogenase